MDVTIFAIVDFPEGPATTSRIRLLSQILIEAGHNVSLAIYHANTKVPLEKNQKSEGNYGPLHYEYLNAKTIRPSGKVDALKDTLQGTWRSVGYMLGKIRKRNIDIVIFYTPDFLTMLPCVVLSLLFRKPIIIELCEIFSSNEDRLLKNRIKRLASVVTEKVVTRVCSGLLVVSTQIKEFVQNSGVTENKIFHLPVLVDFDRINSAPEKSLSLLQGKRYFLNSGTLEEKDGITYILEAFADIHKTYPDIYLVFTGGAHPERIELVTKSAKSHGLENSVIFTGFIPEEQLIWSYQNAIALLCCRSNSRFTNYGFPTKISEYLSTGRPVITTYVGDVPLYLRDRKSAFIAEPENSQSIKECMELIISVPDLALQVGAEGRKVALKEFDYRNFIGPIDSYLKKVTNLDSVIDQLP